MMFWLGLFIGCCGGLFLGGLLCAASRADERAEGAGRGDVPDLRAVHGGGAADAVQRHPSVTPDEVLPDRDLAL